MSAGFGHNKGKDGKYNTLNLATTYKGRSVDTSKHSGAGVRHGLQSLGKVAATRRVPPPASLPSLKSENLGNDPNVNLVPKDGSGWASKSDAPTQSPQQQEAQSQPATQQRQTAATYSQAPVVPPSNQPVANVKPSSQSNGPTQPTWGSPRYSQAVTKMSGASGGAQARGTTHFSEEFPTLGEEKEQQSNQGGKTKELQYGPGPNLRPQNVASWRGGGGQNLTPKENAPLTDDTKSSYSDQLPGMSGSSYEMHQSAENRSASHPNVAQNIPPQHFHNQFRPNMMPPAQFMYNNRFAHPGMPPPGPQMRYQNPMMPGMRYPPYTNDPRFRGMMNQPGPAQPLEGSMQSMAPQSEFKEVEKEDEGESGWAGMQGEVDYAEKLVFSDDEDGSKQTAHTESAKSKAPPSEETKTDKKLKDPSSVAPRHVWGPTYDQQIMAQWSQQYYPMYRQPMPTQPPVDYRNKPPGQFDKRMALQGNQYRPSQMPPSQVYPPTMGAATRFSGPVSEPNSGRMSPRGDEEPWKKNEKEEAMERARKRREEEEKRMEQQSRNNLDSTGYYQADMKRAAPYPQRFSTTEDEMHSWNQDYLPPRDERTMYSRRSESESSDDRRAMRDRMPGDGYGGGGGYRPQPRPSAGGSSGRNLPPRLANQRQKQEGWQAGAPSPGYPSSAFTPKWMAEQSHQQSIKHPDSRLVNPSIMKREHMEGENTENQDPRVRNLSESSSHSLVAPNTETSVDDRQSYPQREFYRKDERKAEDKQLEIASPSTTVSEKDLRVWEAGPSSKRSSIKRQSSRDSPVSAASGGDARHGSQKTLLSRSDSNRNKPVTRWGSNQSNQSLEREEVKQPALVRPRRINDKVKLRDFRVESEDEEDLAKSKKSSNKLSYKSDGRLSGSKLSAKEDVREDSYSSWKNNENKVTKPIATVSPTATTTTATIDSHTSFGVTRITRDVAHEETRDDEPSDSPPSREGDQRNLQSESALRPELPRASWDDEDESQTHSVLPKDSQSSQQDYNRRPNARQDTRSNRNLYHDQADRSSSHRYSAKETRGSNRGVRDSRSDVQDLREDNRGVRRYRASENHYRPPADRPQKSASDRYDNRNRRDNRDSRNNRDFRDNRDHRDSRDGRDSRDNRGPRDNRDARRDNRDQRKEPDESSKGKSAVTSQSQKQLSTKSTTTKHAEKSSIFTSSKPTDAAAPTTNFWEERKKQQEVQQKEAEKNTYIPKEEDRKRTLKETAPVSRFTEDSKFPKDDNSKALNFNKKNRDDNTSTRNQETDSRRRRSSNLSEKRFYEAKPYRTDSNRRGSSLPHRSDRKPIRDYPDNNDRDQRSSTRSRGRSRGSVYRGSTRGRGQSSIPERSSARSSAPPRGRGSRASYRSQYYSSRTSTGREKYDNRRHDDEDDDYDSIDDHASYESDSDPVAVGRRRRVGEGSDAEDDYSSDGSYSESETYDRNIKRSDSSNGNYPRRGVKSGSNSYKSSRPGGRGRSIANGNSTFMARGEPSRRGRGRGSGTTRGRGRGSGTSSTSVLPRSYHSDDLSESKAKNLDRGPRYGADKQRYPIDRRKRRNKQDRPPRFKNTSKTQPPYGREPKSLNSPVYSRQEASSPAGASSVNDGGNILSSDVGNEEWETASDNSQDTRKAPLINPAAEELKKHEPKRSFSNQRPTAGRGRGGRGTPDRLHGSKKAVGNMDNQVYTLHSVDYNNPSAIEGAIRDASSSETKAKKQEEAQKTKHEDLFRLYDMNNYAGVVSVDDLPDAPLEKQLHSNIGLSEDLSSIVDSPLDVKDDDFEGFTPVLSRKSLRKKQEVIRKKDKEEQMNEAIRRAKVEQQRQNRQKFFNKSSTTGIASGTSGSIKQTVTPAMDEDIWSNLETWVPSQTFTDQKESVKEPSISQHDSGVESSVPSSQRSSPGTEAKLSFSHFGVVSTSTSVITSICNHPISSSVVVSQSSVSISNLIATQNKEHTDDQEISSVQQTSLNMKSEHSYTFDEVSTAMQVQSHDFTEVATANMQLQKRDFSEVQSHTSMLTDKQDIPEPSSPAQSKGSMQRQDPALKLPKVLSSTLSPSRLAGNPVVPIGNERLKSSKQGDSIEISCLFSSLDDKNRISFIADDAEEKASSLNLASDEVGSSTFSPYGESLNDMRGGVGTSQGFKGFSQDDYSMDQLSDSKSLSVSTYSMPLSSAPSISTTVALPTSRHVVQPNYIHTSSVMTQEAFMGSSSPDLATGNALSNAGVKSESDAPADMALPPQAPSNDSVGHNGRSLEGSSVPGPIPMPPKHSAGTSQRPDGDAPINSRQLRDVSANASGAGDMGLMTPTSPSVDLNLKMESARKAWEKTAEAPVPPNQQPHGEAIDSYGYHQSTVAASAEQPSPVETSALPSGTLSVTNSTEWKPRQTAETTTAPSDVDEAWRSNLAQQNQSSNAVTQDTQSQSFSKNPAVPPSDEMTNVMSGTDASNSISMAQQQPQKQIATPTYSSSGGNYVLVDPTYNQAHRIAAPQASHSNLYSSSLATNLHNMQQAYSLPPADFTQSLYSTPTYSAQPTYNPLQRDYSQPVMYATTSTAASSAVKTPSQNTIALKPMQGAIRDAGLPTAYVGTSAVQGLDQQGNMGSAQLGLPRPHGGASPAQPITYIPLLDQNRIASSQGTPMVNQTIAASQRPHSSSFYSQLNQPGGNYYAQPAASQLRQQPSFQQAIVAPQAVTYSQGLGLDSSSIWSLHQNPSFAPIAPPAQRLRSDGEYQPQGFQYYQKNVVTANKFVPSTSQAPGGFAAAKSNVPASNYGSGKSNQNYASPKVSTPSNPELAKYSMSSAATSPGKPFSSQSAAAGDWNKSSGMANMQYKNSSVQGILSRPFSSSTDSSYQQSSAVSVQSMLQKPDMSMQPPRMSYSQPTAPPTFTSPQQPGWGHKPIQSNQGMMAAQPPAGMMAKVPRPPVVQTSMMGQRFPVPQNFQSGLSSQLPGAPRSVAPFSMNTRPGGVGGGRMTSPVAIQHFQPSDNMGSSGKGSKTSQASNQSHSKAPPVPTLVRGAGSNLAGKKPTFMPEEVVKSNQANERASLLQSLSNFFPGKDKSDEDAGQSQDWSTQVANSSPLPKRKPGMRHPGIERRKPNNKDSKSGPIGSSKNLKRLQKKKEESPIEPVESIVRPVKKMTLADTKPKKGEVAKIQLN